MQMNPTDKLALTIPDAIASTGIARTRMFRLIKEGKIEAVKLGSRTLILNSSLRAFLAQLPRLKTAA